MVDENTKKSIESRDEGAAKKNKKFEFKISLIIKKH